MQFDLVDIILRLSLSLSLSLNLESGLKEVHQVGSFKRSCFLVF